MSSPYMPDKDDLYLSKVDEKRRNERRNQDGGRRERRGKEDHVHIHSSCPMLSEFPLAKTIR